METWPRACNKVGAGIVLLLIGWMAPQYIAKLCATSFSPFLADQPVSAAFAIQGFWVILLVVPRKPILRQNHELCDKQSLGCSSDLWSSMTFVMFLSVLLLVVHTTWYSSFSRLSVSTNTVLWNTDTITTPVLSMLVSRRRPQLTALGGGVLGLAGTFLAVGAGQEGDTLLGCGLCLVASLAYTLNAVLVQKFVDLHRVPVLRLLGYEGLLPLATLVVVFLGATTLAPLEWHDWFSGLPSFTWLLLLGILSLCLNIGWLWCTETAGAFFAAMVGCLSIPCSMLLDALLFDQWPTIRGGCGAVLVFLGFLVVTYNSTEEADEPTFDRNGNLAPRIHVCSKCDLMSCSWCTCHCRTMPLLGGASLT